MMPKPYYEDEFVTLFHGDCLEVTDWLDADVLVTDPPYGISNESRKGSYKGAGSQIRKYNPIAHDSNIEIRNTVLNIWGNGPAIVFGSWKMPKPQLTKHRLIWHKKGQAPGPTNAPFMVQDEEIYILGDGFVSSSPPMRSVITTTEARSIEVARIGHPTPKPIGLMELLIERCPSGVIADPFAGSGATLIAARNLGRKVIGVELEERYCEIIAKRLSQQAFNFEELQDA
jgi:DNA modification methylase